MEKERVILGENCCYSSDCNETGLNNNIIVCGGSGSGKTMSISEPRLLETKTSSLISTVTSFDYEMIKAHENLQRELAVDIAFSVNNLARAVCDMSNLGNKESDFLLWKRNDIADKLKGRVGFCLLAW